MCLENNLRLILIDFEYAGWNPMAMDVAVLINETMNHNSHPAGNGVEFYLENLMTAGERDSLARTYLSRYFNRYMPEKQRAQFESLDSFFSAHLEPFKRQVLDCCLLNNFFWGVWALQLLNEDEVLKPGIFNFDFAEARCEMQERFLKIVKEES
jgi:thiamine kinase-like enzyme